MFNVIISGEIEECCWPNSRCHWAVKASQVKQLRYTAKLIAAIELQNMEQPPIFKRDDLIAVRWHHVLGKNRRQRDIDNTIAATKPIQDGVFDALGINDRRVRQVEVTWSRDIQSRTIMTVDVLKN